MDLWIRNQDRDALVPIKDAITEFSEALFYQGCILGKYKTKERALEVLDEIQKFIEEFQSVTAELNEYGEVTNVEHHKKVYEIPKE